MRANLEAEEEGLLGKPAPVSDRSRWARVAIVALGSVGLVVSTCALAWVGRSQTAEKRVRPAATAASFLEDLQVKVSDADANSSDTVGSSSENSASSESSGSETASSEASSSAEPASNGGASGAGETADKGSSSGDDNFFVSSSSAPDATTKPASGADEIGNGGEAGSAEPEGGASESEKGEGSTGGEGTESNAGDQGTEGSESGAGTDSGKQQCSNDKENCTETKCCSSPGLVCYMKNANWSSCLQQCEPGKPAPFDAPPYDTPWDCTVLGPPEALNSESSSAEPAVSPSEAPSENSMTTTGDMLTTGDFGKVSEDRAQCSTDAEDCRLTGCCQDPGQQCYEKNEYWGGCRSWCNDGEIFPGDGPENQSPWSCKIITKDDVQVVNFDDGVDRSHCSAKEEDCRDSKCCKNPALSCFEKNDKWASCHLHCVEGVHAADPPEWQTEWSCKVLSADSAEPSDGNAAMDAALGGDGGHVSEEDIAVR